MESLAFQLLTSAIEVALPVAVTFELGNILIGTILRAAFGGRLFFGR